MLEFYEGKAQFKILVVVIKCTKMPGAKETFWTAQDMITDGFPIQAVSSTHMYCHSLLPISHSYFNIDYRSDKYNESFYTVIMGLSLKSIYM